jgi:hypothetical protein
VSAGAPFAMVQVSMLRPIPFVLGFLIPIALLGAFLLWEWSCDKSMGGWASRYRLEGMLG